MVRPFVPDAIRWRIGCERPPAVIAVAFAVAGVLAAGLVAATIVSTRQASLAQRRFEDLRAFAHATVFDVNDALAPIPGTTAARKLVVETALQYLDRLSQRRGVGSGAPRRACRRVHPDRQGAGRRLPAQPRRFGRSHRQFPQGHRGRGRRRCPCLRATAHRGHHQRGATVRRSHPRGGRFRRRHRVRRSDGWPPTRQTCRVSACWPMPIMAGRPSRT